MTSAKKSLRRLIFRNLSAGQLTAYALACFAGLAIVLTAMQFYNDINAPQHDSGEYLTVNKEVSFVSAGSNGFTPQEIDALSRQPWVKDVAGYEASQFQVSAAVDMGGKAMSTYLFFEAIPAEYWDVDTRQLRWSPDGPQKRIPVVIPREYLALYNFGFAASRGLPQVSEGVLGAIPVKIRIQGNGHDDLYDAYIAGFSTRVNTVAVPIEFLRWANSRYAPGNAQLPERLIIHVSRPGDPEIARYLSAHGMQAAGDHEATGRLASFFAIASALVIGVGVVISLLALVILLLSVFLLMQKSRPMLRSLMLLGYSPGYLGSYYCNVVALVNVVVAALSFVAMILARSHWLSSLSAMNLTGGSLLPSALAAAGFALVMSLADILVIRHKLLAIWKS